MTDLPTSVAVLTPPGAAAIATLALVGPRAWSVARALFRPASGAGPLPESPPLDRFWHGQFGGPPGDAVVLTVRRLGPVPWVEVHCHGGPAVVRWLTQALHDHGLSSCEWPEALTRADEPRLSALAASELAHATTQRTAAILLDQWHGAFERAADDIGRLIATGELEAARERVTDLLRYVAVGRHLTRPWRVAVAGAPNVGKSSLVNALAGYRRSVVTPVPGTTRDVVATALAIDGWPVELLDTAGQHATADVLEGQGIDRARSAAARSDLCLWVVDATAPPVWADRPLPNMICVVNKIDVPPAWETSALTDAVHVSARTGSGLDALGEWISRRLVPSPPPAGAAVPFTPELADAAVALADELAAEHTDTARVHLRSLTGRPDSPPPPP
jgi:tRNA modification GTPase